MDYRLAGAPVTSNVGSRIDSPEESASKIRDAVTDAEQILSNIHEAVTALEKRLDTVLTPVPPQAASTAAALNQAISSHLLGRLHLHNETLTSAVVRLRDMARRIEV